MLGRNHEIMGGDKFGILLVFHDDYGCHEKTGIVGGNDFYGSQSEIAKLRSKGGVLAGGVLWWCTCGGADTHKLIQVLVTVFKLRLSNMTEPTQMID